MDAHDLAEKLRPMGAPVEAFDELARGVAGAVRRAGRDGVVCAIGSLYFSADIRSAYTVSFS